MSKSPHNHHANHPLRGLMIVGVASILSGCGHAILNPKGVITEEQKQLLLIVFLLMLIVVIPVFFMIVYFSYQYRIKNKKNIYQPEWSDNLLLESIWWGVPIAIIVVLAIITWRSTYSLNPYQPLSENAKNTILIQAIALDWKWLFIYPKQQIATINYLQLPVNTPIAFHITAVGPMNSFFIPQLAGQIYAMSGMKTRLHLMATQEGMYRGFSANYSGIGFANMYFPVQITSHAAFTQWIKTIKKLKRSLTLHTFQQLSKPSSHFMTGAYSDVSPDLFYSIMNQYHPSHHPLQHSNNQLES